MLATNAAYSELRASPRDEVHHRARALGPDLRPVSLLVVNISATGLMARCDTEYQSGDRLRVQLPGIGSVVAQIRWSLGGRIGCEFDRPIALPDYNALLATLTKSR